MCVALFLSWIVLLGNCASLLTIAADGEVVDWSCRGYRYGDIDWDNVRSTLEIYADKYLDRPQLLADMFKLSSEYSLEYHPENKCVLGDLTLRFFLWLSFEQSVMRESVAALSSRRAENLYESLLQETYDWFWELDVSWSVIVASGWPIFSVIAVAAARVRDEKKDPCVPAERLDLYLNTFDQASYVSTSVDVATLLDASHCPDAVASALFSLADNHRANGQLGQNRFYQFAALDTHLQPPETDMQDLLSRAEALLRRHRGWNLITSPWPVWRLLDRLSAVDAVEIGMKTAKPFWMYVFPHRVRSDGLISNRIRATSSAYCLQLFQDEVLRIAGSSSQPLRLVEAGPHIGDCMLWASAALGDRVRGLAVEPVPQVVSLFRRSIARNGFNIELHNGWLGSKPSPPLPGASVPWLSLDSLLAEDVHILKIHTNGGERSILDGAVRLFEHRRVGVVIVHSAEPDELWNSIVFLLARGYPVTTSGKTLSLADEAWLKLQVQERGGLQIHAVRRD